MINYKILCIAKIKNKILPHSAAVLCDIFIAINLPVILI